MKSTQKLSLLISNRLGRVHLVLLAAGLIAVAGFSLGQSEGVTVSQKPVLVSITQPVLVEVVPSTVDLLTGNWEQQNHGRRTLTVRDDGTATMVVYPEVVGKFLVGDRLEVDIQWELKDKILTFEMTGGKPAGKIEFVKTMWGSKRDHRIEKLTTSELLLLDEDLDPDVVWNRVEVLAENATTLNQK